MILLNQEFAHPTQASPVRLTVYEEPGTGWLVTETHGGSHPVVKTLGLYGSRDEALGRARSRGQSLESQRYQPVSGAN
jgi:hypothetical protein